MLNIGEPVKKLLLSAALPVGTVLIPLASLADGMMFSYNTLLSPVDAFSSKGVPLEGWCSILQQDRANFHRFKKRDADDESDPFFTTPERRAMMTGKCEVDPGAFKDPGAQIRSGNRQFHLIIQVFGNGNKVTKIRTADAF